ncbi:MAG TPA: alanyl-tRNA editing protein [Candidatus Nanoarchaeia archaeon]|nr:alanyl-tRNA editing protein [Candidatus Nanoarchaeia archaeon]
MIKNSKIDSALHVLKGAAQNVLGTTLTTNVYEEGDKGRLTVECTQKPTEEDIQEVEVQANAKILENIPIHTLEMDRTEAETEFGSTIYDKFPVPSHIRQLRLVQIKDWNINCCIGNHTSTTGEIGRIQILKYRYRDTKKELEISFSI